MYICNRYVYVCNIVTSLIREYAGTKKRRFKPIIISHHMLSGLKEGQEKMSKSKIDPPRIRVLAHICTVNVLPMYIVCT
jgi:hypothetical protein